MEAHHSYDNELISRKLQMSIKLMTASEAIKLITSSLPEDRYHHPDKKDVINIYAKPLTTNPPIKVITLSFTTVYLTSGGCIGRDLKACIEGKQEKVRERDKTMLRCEASIFDNGTPVRNGVFRLRGVDVDVFDELFWSDKEMNLKAVIDMVSEAAAKHGCLLPEF